MESPYQDVLREALEKAAGNTTVSAKYIIRLVKDFNKALAEHQTHIEQNQAALGETKATASQLANAQHLTEQMLAKYDAVIEELKQIKQGEPGKNADEESIVNKVLESLPKPKDGKTPAFDAVVRAVLMQMPNPKDGKDAVVDYDKLAEKAVDALVSSKKLKKEHVQGLDAEIASYRNQLAGKHYGKDTWARGGGTTVYVSETPPSNPEVNTLWVDLS